VAVGFGNGQLLSDTTRSSGYFVLSGDARVNTGPGLCKFYFPCRKTQEIALQKCNIELRIVVDLLSFDSALIYSGQLVFYVVGPEKKNSRGSGAFAAAIWHHNNFTHWGKNLIDMIESVYPDPGRQKKMVIEKMVLSCVSLWDVIVSRHSWK
jgi:hypothetical protein